MNYHRSPIDPFRDRTEERWMLFMLLFFGCLALALCFHLFLETL